MMPTPADLATYTGEATDQAFTDRAASSLTMATAMVKAYVRGNGFTDNEPEDDLAAVIVSCTARLMSNPQHTRQITTGPFAQTPGVFNGWTLPELAVLHRYRKRAT